MSTDRTSTKEPLKHDLTKFVDEKTLQAGDLRCQLKPYYTESSVFSTKTLEEGYIRFLINRIPLSFRIDGNYEIFVKIRMEANPHFSNSHFIKGRQLRSLLASVESLRFCPPFGLCPPLRFEIRIIRILE